MADGAQVTYNAGEICAILMRDLADGLDHPDIWQSFPQFLGHFPELPEVIAWRLEIEPPGTDRTQLAVLLAMARAALDSVDAAIEDLEPVAVDNSVSAMVQGAMFHLHRLRDPENPRYQLETRFCSKPFRQLDVLEASTHLCCASWLQASIGDLTREDWPSVWNSDAAQAIRASIHDGSYRYCNKTGCSWIQGDSLPTMEEAAGSEEWREIIETGAVALEEGPSSVNLAYDRTCNLSCPSCRTEKFAADREMRAMFDDMQTRNVLPLLADTRVVTISGAGDPFASKNFRRLLEHLGPDDYPDLRFQVMTNGMLLTRREWARFPALHGRVEALKISIDAATARTHETLRRGARWPVMLENMQFFGELRAAGLVDAYDLTFVVQQENYLEMGDAVDLAHAVGADTVYFGRMINWSTFSDEEFQEKAVFMPSHPEYGRFLEAMRDPRLRDPIVAPGPMQPFIDESWAA